MHEKEAAFFEAYCKAIETKDASHLRPYLHPEVSFSSPMAQVVGKEVYLEKLGGFLAFAKKVVIRTRFLSDNQLAIFYDTELPNVEKCPAAALIAFEGGLACAIELFFDGRPFGT